MPEDFYAWQLGPVIPQIYTEYSIFSSANLPAQTQTLAFSQDDLNTIDYVLEQYAYSSTWTLVELSHKQDPWKYNYEIFGDRAIIPYETIKDYFNDYEGV